MRLISSSRAYAIASQWGSFNDASDPGRCLYGFHYGDGRPVSDQHRSDCLLYLRGILNQGGPGAMSVRSERDLRSLIRFLANCPIRPGDRAPAMVALPVQQQQGRHVPGSLDHYRADRAYLLRSIRALRSAGDTEGVKDEQDDLRIIRQGFADVRHAAPIMVPQQVQQQQAKHGPSIPKHWPGPLPTTRDVAACEMRRAADAAEDDEPRAYTVTLTVGDLYAKSPQEAAALFRECMASDWPHIALTYTVRDQETGRASDVDLEPAAEDAA